MDDPTHQSAQSISEATIHDVGSAQYAGAFFPLSRDFAVAGGVFTSNATHIYNAPSSFPADFRRIPLGDIDLQREIRLDAQSGVVHRIGERGSVRRMHSAKIDGRSSNMTVALYQGDNAEEEWRQAISRHSRLRHPNFFQIFAAASSSGIHAIVAHDDLIRFRDFLEPYRHSNFSIVSIFARADAEYTDARGYFTHMCQTYLASHRLDHFVSIHLIKALGKRGLHFLDPSFN
ncbi:hypothetical protein C8J57DRAFT_1598824 [Mycena rebaudengoi]|nr:hypothetical protein C8J57DRAFT_1598824 [Mycena rebaudengoi]